MSRTLTDFNRRNLNFNDYKIGEVLPEHFTKQYPTLITFLEKYYQFMDSDVNLGYAKTIHDLLTVRDIEATPINLLDQLINEIGVGILSEDFFLNPRIAAKLMADFYRVKGTLFSSEGFFRAFYNSEVEVKYPKDNIFIVNQSLIGPEDLDVLQDGRLYQIYSVLVRSEIPIVEWSDLYKKLVHPAGFYLGSEVIISTFADFLIGEMPTALPDSGANTVTFETVNLGEDITDDIVLEAQAARGEIEVTGLLYDSSTRLRISYENSVDKIDQFTVDELDSNYPSITQLVMATSPTADADWLKVSNQAETADRRKYGYIFDSSDATGYVKPIPETSAGIRLIGTYSASADFGGSQLVDVRNDIVLADSTLPIQAGDFILAASGFSYRGILGTSGQAVTMLTDSSVDVAVQLPWVRWNVGDLSTALRPAYNYIANDSNLFPTFIEIGPSGSSGNSSNLHIWVFRGVDSDKPIDIAAQRTTGVGASESTENIIDGYRAWNNADGLARYDSVAPETLGAMMMTFMYARTIAPWQGSTINNFADSALTTQSSDTYDGSMASFVYSQFDSTGLYAPEGQLDVDFYQTATREYNSSINLAIRPAARTPQLTYKGAVYYERNQGDNADHIIDYSSLTPEAGDVALFLIQNEGEGSFTYKQPKNTVEIFNENLGGLGGPPSARVAYKVLDSAGDNTLRFGTWNNDGTIVSTLLFTDAAAPVLAATESDGSHDTSAIVWGNASVNAGDYLIAFVSGRNAGTLGTPAGYTNIHSDNAFFLLGTNGSTINTSYKVIAAGGVESPDSSTWSGGGGWFSNLVVVSQKPSTI